MRLYSEGLSPRRLDRALADLGACSRREAVRWVLAGRVRVDGREAREPRLRVDPARQVLSVDGGRLSPDPERLVYAFHKPAAVLTTRADPAGRRTVYDALPPGLPWLFPVGRLDRDSSGLLILTNDHRLAHALTDPRACVPKTYHVRVAGVVGEPALRPLREGLTLEDGTPTRPAAARTLGATRQGESWLEVVIREGRYRQVRRMCAAVGHPVLQLVRVGFGGLSLGDPALGDLPEGALCRLGPEAARLLRLGPQPRSRGSDSQARRSPELADSKL